MDWLTTKINKEFNDKFSFLKLLEVHYDRSNSKCLITFLFPENRELSDFDKNLISNYIKQELKLNSSVTVKFKKSYLTNDLVINTFLSILKNDFPPVNALTDLENISVKKDFNSITITIQVDQSFLNFIDENNLKKSLKISMEEKFCSEFVIEIEKIQLIEKLPSITLVQNFFVQKTPRYSVKITEPLFGGEISQHPEYIRNITSDKNSVILAGKVINFEKKSYESKKEKTKGKLKYYYCFELDDSTSRIDARYFSSIASEKKMDKLKNGDEVIIIGDVKSFNKRLCLYVKSIALCCLPEKIEYKPLFNNNYEVVKPENHSVLSQENLFKRSLNYSEEFKLNTYVVFDVETTGLDYQADELVEIGAVKIQNGIIISKFSSLIKPKNPIPLSSSLINNITDEMVKNAPSADVVIRDFYRYTRGCILVGYNVSFDQRFIQFEGKKQGLEFDNEYVDALALARAKLKLTRYKLSDVVKRMQVDLKGAHRALADTLATAEVFLKLSAI
jgi:DNA polymerase III epsilon subunit family exonuclease